MEARLQSNLISWLQEANVGIEEHNATGRLKKTINTKNILFMSAGAFSGYSGSNDDLISIIAERCKGESLIGFGSDVKSKKLSDTERKKLLHDVTPVDICRYGLKPELVGRLHALAVFDDLDKEMKRRILRESEDSPVKKYEISLNRRGFDVFMDNETMDFIAEKSPKETGARGLIETASRVYREIIFDPLVYANEEKNITIDKKLVEAILAQQ
jgi:ATP-dependent Clp protease ATP-binding subunit ClpX